MQRMMIGSVGALCLAVSTAWAQTCPLPPTDCTGALHCGGQWDFEAGMYHLPHYLAGQCGAPPGGGNQSCVPQDKTSTVGNGWTHWASFPTWTTPGYWGTPSFNENKNCANVHKGNRSQEITMTCANGVGVIYKHAAVPIGSRIKATAEMKFTPNGAEWPDVEHALGIDPTGGTNPTANSVQWFNWINPVPSPPQPSSVFNHVEGEVISQAANVTIYIRQLAYEPPCMGQTFLVDNVKVFDLGAPGPRILATPTSLTQTTPVGINAGSQQFTIRNNGTDTLNYSISTNAGWVNVSPNSGTATVESDLITVTYVSAPLSPGEHNAEITIASTNALNAPVTIPVTLTIAGKAADFDGDGDVDQSDFGRFQRCLSGPGIVVGPACKDADFDGDNDVDQNDFGTFQECMSGAGVPSDPTCASP